MLLAKHPFYVPPIDMRITVHLGNTVSQKPAVTLATCGCRMTCMGEAHSTGSQCTQWRRRPGPACAGRVLFASPDQQDKQRACKGEESSGRRTVPGRGQAHLVRLTRVALTEMHAGCLHGRLQLHRLPLPYCGRVIRLVSARVQPGLDSLPGPEQRPRHCAARLEGFQGISRTGAGNGVHANGRHCWSLRTGHSHSTCASCAAPRRMRLVQPCLLSHHHPALPARREGTRLPFPIPRRRCRTGPGGRLQRGTTIGIATGCKVAGTG
ncbi:hypothetical protein B0T11DRAFT_18615 [Plectosphaerella cucumerina]|uniref:Uncharacterized protein n=1 Tax=Plectosphaerella cucumerina TaxID=40658 RepID=A0A8K0TVS1_9PEZI|nr:hypothetical protein B0T11DRAFT_18615 [Plectosphaerella cucumerina]